MRSRTAWLSVALWFIPAVFAASNADNYFCKACGVVMEAMHVAVIAETDMLQSRLDAGQLANVTIPVQAMAAQICDDNKFKATHTDFILEGCREIITKNALLVSSMFAGEAPTPALTYARTYDACVTKMNLCDVPEVRASPMNACDSCLAVVQDIADVLVRRKGKPGYRSRAHVASVIDTICSNIELRHPPAEARRLIDMCDDLVSDLESEVLAAFTAQGKAHPGKALCGSEGLSVCKQRKGAWDGVHGPFTRVPSYATKDHAEL